MRSRPLEEQFVQRRHGVGRPALRHVEHHLLGFVDGGFDVFGHRVRDVGDLTGHADEPAQQRVLLDDGGVVPGIGDRRGIGLQRDEDRRVTHRLEQPGALELVGDGHRVDRLTPLDEGPDGAEDVPVCRLVEVGRPSTSRSRPTRHRWRAASPRGATPPLRGCGAGPGCVEGAGAARSWPGAGVVKGLDHGPPTLHAMRCG